MLAISCAAAAASCRQPPPPKTATPDTVRPTYDQSGSLTKLEADSDHDGLIDMWAYMDGPRVVRVDVDENGDGTVDRWEYHRQLPSDTVHSTAAQRKATDPSVGDNSSGQHEHYCGAFPP